MTERPDDLGDLDRDLDEPEFDEPIADPTIRADYREALGRFIMAHNEVDFRMTGILAKAVKMLAPDGSLDGLALGDFSARATNLTLLMKTAPHLALGRCRQRSAPRTQRYAQCACA